ncbi:MAG TPA: beta-ketoacyl synthase N-terminal-like domain-containing protein [Candidatus Polarisedimenticolaceae bacterium]|nr:beta-ketoacyl synthase N-terminal-like domain-containing protein [Candidatus Polarisedimenticolaceae bacterium]
MNPRDVVVVGMACVFPGADDVATFWRNVVAGKDAIGDVPAGRWPGSRLTELPPDHEGHVGCRRGGFISTPYLFDPLRHRVMPRVARHGDVDQFILLDVIADALADAAIGEGAACRATTDVILGRGNYTSNKMLEVFLRSDGCDRILAFLGRRLPQLTDADLAALERELRASLPPRDPDGMATAITNLTASRAANRLDLGGAAFVVDAACASSLVAMEIGVERLREGKCDVAVVAGINFTNVPGFWYLFSQLGAFSPSGQIRPFDRRADGILIGEGAGAVVLKRAERARRDGDRVYALVKGLGSASDGKAAGVLAPSSGGQVRALERAYHDAGLEPEVIGLLEAHGTGTPTGDRVEIETLRRVFGPPLAGVPTRVMGSVKSMIGHAMPAAGIASFIKVALALTGKILPPSLHCDQPEPALAELPFFLSPVARPWLQSPKDGPRRAAVNAFGFGGINAHVIVEEVLPENGRPTSVAVPGPPAADLPPLRPRPLRPGIRPPTELLAFSADDRPALAGRLRQVARFLECEGRPFDLADLSHTLAAETDTRARCRLALIRPGLDGLAGELVKLAARVEGGAGIATAEGAGLYYGDGEATPAGHIAAVFPGIAFPGLTGEFPDHLLTNCMHFPVAREVFDLVERRDEHPDDPLPTSLILVPPPHLDESRRARIRNRFAPAAAVPEGQLDRSPPAERNLSHMGTLVNNWAGWQILRSLDIEIDMLCGQSLGDLSAVLSAGMADFEESIPNFWKAFNLEIPYVGSGAILMVGAAEEQLTPLLDGLADVSIAIHLSPSVLVVGGSERGIGLLAERLRGASIFSQKLPFPPIHTPRLLEFQEALAAAMGETAPLRPARVTIYSAVLAAPMPDDPEQVAELLRSNVSRPIRFWQTQRRMVDDGARFIVQIGSGTLAASSRAVLDRSDVKCIAMDVGERHPVTQIQTLCAQLFADGLQLKLDGLFAARQPRMLALTAPAPADPPSPTALPLTLYWPPLWADEEAPAGPAPVAASEPATMLPFLGRVERFEPGRRIAAVTRLELDEHRYLAHHVFLNITGVKSLRDCGPVLPLTFTLEMLAETAACLAPGLGLIGLTRVRARRWIGFDGVDAIDVRVEAELDGADADCLSISARATFDGEVAAEAVIRFAARYRQTIDLAFHQPVNPRRFPLTAKQVYDGRYFFHGPLFHCVEALDVMSDRGATGRMVVAASRGLFRSLPNPQLLLDPVALDGAGQVVGAHFLERDISLLPVSVDAIEFYRPAPAPGTRTPVHVEFTEIDLEGRRAKSNIEVQDGEGRVWFRVLGWQDVLYLCRPSWTESQRRPERATLSTRCEIDGVPADVVVMRVTREDVRHVPPAWLAKSFLHADEERRVPWGAGQDPRTHLPWILGRVAAKDAARAWRARTAPGSPMAHPVEVVLANDGAGRPHVEAIAGAGPVPVISLSHGEAGAVAIAADRPVGIDVEAIDAGAALTLADFATDAERGLLERLAGMTDDPSRVTRLWCAKEAAAKLVGSGLGGRPKEFEAVDADSRGRLTIAHRPTGRRIDVRTSVDDRLLLAVAVAATGVAPGRAGR